MKAKTNKILKISLEIVVGVVALCFFALFIFSKTSGGPVFIGGKTTMWILTGSMDPTIPPRTYILVEKVSGDDVDVGDIVVFVSTDPKIEGQYNTHRIISKNGDTFVTKGDGNALDDGAYSAQKEKIVGRYVKTLPVMTFLGRVVLSPAGFAVLIVLFIFTTVIAVVPSVKEAIKDKSSDDAEAKKLEMERRIKEEVEKLERSGVSAEELHGGVEKDASDEKNEKREQ
ncbi:MAG: signal peptidase I [Clostridia bacterium]|nr:signal peptidase I [Clostridia bacterium]